MHVSQSFQPRSPMVAPGGGCAFMCAGLRGNTPGSSSDVTHRFAIVQIARSAIKANATRPRVEPRKSDIMQVKKSAEGTNSRKLVTPKKRASLPSMMRPSQKKWLLPRQSS